MSRFIVVAGVLAGLVFGTVGVAQADPVSAGAMIRLSTGAGTGGNGGGEFYADVLNIGSGTFDFITFCMQRGEYFTPGATMWIGDVSTATQAGNNPISPETAWLYTQFRSGTLPNYAFSGDITFNSVSYNRAGTATALQLAFWMLEGQNMAGLPTNFLAANFVDQAKAAGWTGIGDVRVLNLYGSYNATTGVYSGDKQDQLALVESVPEPGTLSLLGLGLLVGARLVKKQQASR